MKIANLAVIIIVMLAACSHPAHEVIPTSAKVLVLGDSITYGTGAGKGEDYPSLLEAESGWKIINAGVAGDTSSDGLDRLPDLLEKHAPKLVLVELGGNDLKESLNLKSIIEKIKVKNIPVVIIGVPAFNPVAAAFGSLSDSPIYEKIGKETGTAVIPDVISKVLGKNSLKSDPVHPNALGYRKLEEGIRDFLIDQGYLKS